MVEDVGEILALDILHGDEFHALSFTQVVDTNHIAVGDLGGEDQFLLEAVKNGVVASQVRAYHLEGDETVELNIFRLINGAHAAFAQQAQNLVALGQQVARSQDVLSSFVVIPRHGVREGDSHHRRTVTGNRHIGRSAKDGIGITGETNVGGRAFTLHGRAHAPVARF